MSDTAARIVTTIFIIAWCITTGVHADRIDNLTDRIEQLEQANP